MNKQILSLVFATSLLGQAPAQANIFHFIGDVANVIHHNSCCDVVREIDRTLDEIASYEMMDFMDKFPRDLRSNDYLLQDIRSDFKELSRRWIYFINHYAQMGNSPWYGEFESILNSVKEIKIALRRFHADSETDSCRYKNNLRNIHDALRDITNEMRPGWWSGNYGWSCLQRIRNSFNDVAHFINRMN